MISEEEIRQAMIGQAKEFGYVEADCKVSEHKEFKCVWERNTHIIRFNVADYFKYLSENACKDIARVVCSKIKSIDATYSEDTMNELTGKNFYENTQPIYLERHSSVITHDYDYILDEFVSEGCVKKEDIEGVVIAWDTGFASAFVDGVYSSLFRVIRISQDISNENDIRDIIRYDLYQLLDGLRSFGKDIDVSRIIPDLRAFKEDLEERGLRV